MCRDSKHFLVEPSKAPWLRVRLTVLSVAAEHSRTVPAFTRRSWRTLWRGQPAGCCLQNGTGLLLYISGSIARNHGLPAAGYYYGVFATSDYHHHIPDSITLLLGNEKRKIEFGSGLVGVTARIILTPSMAPWVRRLADGWASAGEWRRVFVAALPKVQLPSVGFPNWLKAIDRLFQPTWVTELLCLAALVIVFAATTVYAR